MNNFFDDLFWSSIKRGLARPNADAFLEGYRYALVDTPATDGIDKEHRYQIVVFLEACLQEQQRSTYRDRETIVYGESSHV